MSIRTKIAIIAVLTMLLYAGFDLMVQRAVIGPSFVSLERDEARKDMERCINALRREAHHLEQFCSDWSMWDDTYVYVQNPHPEFERSNLVPKSFTDNDLFLIFILNNDGDVVWGQCFNLELNSPISVADFPTDTWGKDHPLLNRMNPAEAKTGVLPTERGFALLAACPILASDAKGPVRGTLVMGRLLDDAMIQLLIEQTQVQMRLAPVAASAGAGGAPLTGDGHSPQIAIETLKDNSEKLLAQALINDVADAPAFLLQAIIDREISAKGAAATRLDAIGAFLIGLCILLFLLLMMHRTVATPLLRLTDHVIRIGRSGTLLPVDLGVRADEFGALAREFNAMVHRLNDDAATKRRAEAALRDSESTLRAILQAAPDAIIVVNEAGLIESCNAAAEKTFGIEAVRISGTPLDALFYPEDQPLLEQALSPMRCGNADNTPHGTLALRGVNTSGESFPMHAAFGLASLRNRPLFIGVFRDISELVRMHERIAEHQHLAKLGELGASVAHEIRNPIAGVSGLLQNIHKQAAPDDPRRPALEEALAQISRVNNTVQQLLFYARPWQPSKSPCNARKAAQQVCDEIAQAGRVENRVLAVAQEGNTMVFADPVLLERVLHNVINNAIDATAPDGRIDVSFEKVDNATCIRVEDTGAGLRPELRERVFEPFFTTKMRGTGLGLAICRRIMEAHDGVIRFSEGRESGLCVEMIFPEKNQT